MKNLSEEEFIDESLPDIGFKLTDEDEIVIDLMSISGCSGWGFDTYSNLKIWKIKSKEFGFSVDIHLDGTPDDETSILGTSITAKVQGNFIKYGKKWELDNYEVMEADFDSFDEDYFNEDYLDAILYNTEFHKTFCQEISNLQVLNNLDITDLNAQNTLKRQIYIGAITCLETYLSDAFINTVLSEEKYLKSFFAEFEDFKSQKFELSKLFTLVESSEQKAKETLSKVLYHNLPKVSKMYNSTLNIIFPDFSEIQKHISIRHDLVHRGGKTKKNEDIDVDRTTIKQIIDDIQNFVNDIDEQLQQKVINQTN